MTATSNPLQVLVHTFRHGGVRAFYTGLSLPLSAQAVYKATVFCVNNATQSAVTEWNTQERLKRGNLEPYRPTLTDKFVCGAVGGAVNALLFVTPVELVRNQQIAHHTRAATQTAPSSSSSMPLKGPVEVIQRTLAKDGVTGLWRGAMSAVTRDSLGCGMFFLVFGYCQQTLQKRQAEHSGGNSSSSSSKTAVAATTLVSGAAAGLGFWLVALPLDTLKTWVQSGSVDSAWTAWKESVGRHGVASTLRQLCRGWPFALGGAPPRPPLRLEPTTSATRGCKHSHH